MIRKGLQFVRALCSCIIFTKVRVRMTWRKNNRRCIMLTITLRHARWRILQFAQHPIQLSTSLQQSEVKVDLGQI